MSTRRKLSWWKTLGLATAIVGAGSLLWLTEVRFIGTRSAPPIVESFGFLSFVLGVVVAIVIAGLHWWREFREIAELKRKYGHGKGKDT